MLTDLSLFLLSPTYQEFQIDTLAPYYIFLNHKLNILLDRFKDDSTKKSAQAVIDKLGRISDKSYADLYSVRQRKMECEKENSLGNRLKVAREKAEKHNAEVKNLVVERRKGKGIVL